MVTVHVEYDLTLLPEILSKRPFRNEFGEMTIDEVNNLLDRLSAVSKECVAHPASI
jgi:hypothetical protein